MWGVKFDNLGLDYAIEGRIYILHNCLMYFTRKVTLRYFIIMRFERLNTEDAE